MLNNMIILNILIFFQILWMYLLGLYNLSIKRYLKCFVIYYKLNKTIKKQMIKILEMQLKCFNNYTNNNIDKN